MTKHNETHQENLDFIAHSLQNKPVTAALFKQVLEFNANNLVSVKVVFPERKVPLIEFERELIAKGILEPERVNNSKKMLTNYERYY